MKKRRVFLTLRSRVLQAVREFFWARDFIEVETPVRLPAPALEEHIEALPAGEQYLRTSPELHIKRLLGEGVDRMFELGPCFRAGEAGARHRPEFTLLEWYRANADYDAILKDTRALVCAVVRAIHGTTAFIYRGTRIDVGGAWAESTVQDAFRRAAGWDPIVAYDADRFDADLIARVEPSLPVDRPVVLRDYPAPAAALARLKPGDPAVAERWELYIGGLELANAFSELVDAAEQRRRFEACAAKRSTAGRTVYPLDEPFLAALESGLPPCAGIALGIDRLVMLLGDARRIDEVRAF